MSSMLLWKVGMTYYHRLFEVTLFVENTVLSFQSPVMIQELPTPKPHKASLS